MKDKEHRWKKQKRWKGGRKFLELQNSLKIENTESCKFERLKIKQLLTANHGSQQVSGLLEK